MCILYLERFFGVGGVEVAEYTTTDQAEAGWDITSPAAAHEAANCKTIRNATHYPT